MVYRLHEILWLCDWISFIQTNHLHEWLAFFLIIDFDLISFFTFQKWWDNLPLSDSIWLEFCKCYWPFPQLSTCVIAFHNNGSELLSGTQCKTACAIWPLRDALALMTDFGPSSENGGPWENVTLKVTALQIIYLPDRATTPVPPNWSRHYPGCHRQPRVCLGRRLNHVIAVGTRQHPGYSRGNQASSARPAERWNVGLLGYELWKGKLENWRNKSSSEYNWGQSEGGPFF